MKSELSSTKTKNRHSIITVRFYMYTSMCTFFKVHIRKIVLRGVQLTPGKRAARSKFTAYKGFIAHCQPLLLNPHDL